MGTKRLAIVRIWWGWQGASLPWMSMVFGGAAASGEAEQAGKSEGCQNSIHSSVYTQTAAFVVTTNPSMPINTINISVRMTFLRDWFSASHFLGETLYFLNILPESQKIDPFWIQNKYKHWHESIPNSLIADEKCYSFSCLYASAIMLLL